MGNKVYAVLDNQSGIVFARLLVKHHQYVSLGPTKIGIRDYWNAEPYGLHRIVDATLSDDPKYRMEIKQLDLHDFITVNTHKDYNCDYLLYVNNIDAFESRFN